MRVVCVRWWGFRIPFRSPPPGPWTARHGLLVEVLTERGWRGIGEASPPTVGDGEAVEGVARRVGRAGSALLGLSVEEALWALPSLLPLDHPLAGPARFGLETALYDLLGQERGRPLTALLGGSARSVRVNALLPEGEPQEVARFARSAAARGFPALKLKVGRRSPEEDEAVLEAVRRAVGPAVALRVDANGAWTPEQAVAAIRRLERFGLEYVEQPVPAGGVEDLLRVRRAVGVPLAADESVRRAEDARLLIEAGAVSVAVVKGARMGLVEAARAVRLAEEAGGWAVVTSSLESGVGVAASLHLAGLLPPGGPACGLATGALLEGDLLRDPPTPEGGVMEVPPGPGLGVSVDPEALRHYAFGPSGAVRG